MTKLEMEWDETKHRLVSLHPPRPGLIGHPTTYFTAWVRRAEDSPSFPSDYGRGDTPQEAINAAIERLEAAIAGGPRKMYNDTVARPARVVPKIDINLDDILDGL